MAENNLNFWTQEGVAFLDQGNSEFLCWIDGVPVVVSPVVLNSGSLVGTAVLTGTGSLVRFGAGALSGLAVLIGAAVRVAEGEGTLSGLAVLVGDGAIIPPTPPAPASGNLIGVAKLEGLAFVIHPGAGQIVGRAGFTGSIIFSSITSPAQIAALQNVISVFTNEFHAGLFIDYLRLRRVRLRYVSPPVCPVVPSSGSGSSLMIFIEDN